MEGCSIALILGLLVWTVIISNVSSTEKHRVSRKRSETLDPNKKYNITWEVCDETERVTFEVNVATSGYVGFGISSGGGGMTGADIVIGGVYSNGTTYFEDRYAKANGIPLVDEHQDWTLLNSSQKEGHTYLKFSRPIKSCNDTQDVSITSDAQKFIWAIGNDDDIKYHKATRGSYSVHILDPPSPQLNLTQYSKFDASLNLTMPGHETTYWCSVHKSPKFTKKQHVVAFGPKMDTPTSKKHIHHLSFYKCTVPEGSKAKEIFDPYITTGGKDCFAGTSYRALDLYEICTTPVYFWAMGAKELHMPEGVGFPIAESINGEEDGTEYYFLEVHLDNPEAKSGISLEYGVEIHYTSNLRPIEAGVFTMGFSVYTWKLLIPPNSTDFLVAGHCPSSCSKLMEPEGYNFFNVQLHGHRSARKMRLRQFRDGKELPWIGNDQLYDQSFQSYRNIEPIKKFLPGDHLTLECKYDSTWTHPSKAVIGGYGIQNEMCSAGLYYYPKGSFSSCGSDNSPYRLMKLLGIKRFQFPIDENDPIIEAPSALKGKKYIDYVSNMVNWTEELRSSVQKELSVGPHLPFCINDGVDPDTMRNILTKDRMQITYPQIDKEYTSQDGCTQSSASVLEGVKSTLVVSSSLISLSLIGGWGLH